MIEPAQAVFIGRDKTNGTTVSLLKNRNADYIFGGYQVYISKCPVECISYVFTGKKNKQVSCSLEIPWHPMNKDAIKFLAPSAKISKVFGGVGETQKQTVIIKLHGSP